jgi:peptidoglycan hydrolase-like protein with peptidoglycan-binding domain
VSSPTLKKGARGQAVKRLQKLLAQHGAKVTIDGDFGQRTKASVVAFQRRNHLAADGVVGPKTWAKLKAEQKAA